MPLCWPEATADAVLAGTPAGARLQAIRGALAETRERWLPVLDAQDGRRAPAKRPRRSSKGDGGTGDSVGNEVDEAGEAGKDKEESGDEDAADAWSGLGASLAAAAAPRLAWALACVLSRAFSVPVDGNGPGARRELCCVPVLDMLDHNSDARVEYRHVSLETSGDGGAFELVLPAGADAGAALWHVNYETYGERRDNAAWLSNYGFRVDDDDDDGDASRDVCSLVLRAEGCDARELMRAVGRPARYAEVRLYAGSGLSSQTLEAAAVVAASPGERYAMCATSTLSGGNINTPVVAILSKAQLCAGASVLHRTLVARGEAAAKAAAAARAAPSHPAFDPCREAAARTAELQAEICTDAIEQLGKYPGLGDAPSPPACLELDVAAPEQEEDKDSALMRATLARCFIIPHGAGVESPDECDSLALHYLPAGPPEVLAWCIKRVLAALAIYYLDAESLREAGGEALAGAISRVAAAAAVYRAAGNGSGAFDASVAAEATRAEAATEVAAKGEYQAMIAFVQRLEATGGLEACTGLLGQLGQARWEELTACVAACEEAGDEEAAAEMREQIAVAEKLLGMLGTTDE